MSFGCMCTSVERTSSNFSYEIQQMKDGKSILCQATSKACKAQSLCRCQLGMQVYVNGEQKQIKVLPTGRLFTSGGSQNEPVDTNLPEMKPNNRPPLDTYVNISELVDIQVESGKSSLLMVVFAFTNGAVPELPRNALSSDSVRAILGVTDGLNNCVSHIWKNDRIKDHDQIDADSITSIARCVEYICSVKTIPVCGTQDVSVTSAIIAPVTTGELPQDNLTSNSTTRSNRTSIHHEVELSMNALPVNPESEVPKNSEILHVLVKGPSQQSNGSAGIVSPSTPTLRQPEDGEPLPSSIPLPVSRNSSSSVVELEVPSDRNQQIENGKVEDKDDTQEFGAVALIRNIMNSQYVDLEDALYDNIL